MEMTNEYEDALEVFDNCIKLGKPTEYSDHKVLDPFPLALVDPIRHALRIAAKLQEEPSQEMYDIADAAELRGFGEQFKAMVEQLLKEVENDY